MLQAQNFLHEKINSFLYLYGKFQSFLLGNGEKKNSWQLLFSQKNVFDLYFSGLKMWYHSVKKIFSKPYTQNTMFTWWYKGSTKINKISIMLSLWRFWCMLCLFCHTYKTDNFIQLKLFFMKICWRNLYKLCRWVRKQSLD